MPNPSRLVFDYCQEIKLVFMVPKKHNINTIIQQRVDETCNTAALSILLKISDQQWAYLLTQIYHLTGRQPTSCFIWDT